MKKNLAIFALATTCLLSGQVANAATTMGLAYYDVVSGSTNYSSTFTNTDGTVVINGWQTNDAPLRFTPSVTYAVVSRHYLSPDDVWASQPVTQDYPQSGSWYSYILSGVPSRTDLSIRVIANTGYNTRGAGNAY